MLKANDLVRITDSFDIMRNAINYILDSQKDQTVLINELLEASRDAPLPAYTVVEESDHETKSEPDKKSEGAKSTQAQPQPDYSRLHRDFDRRISALEHGLRDHEKKIDVQHRKNNDHDSKISKRKWRKSKLFSQRRTPRVNESTQKTRKRHQNAEDHIWLAQWRFYRS